MNKEDVIGQWEDWRLHLTDALQVRVGYLQFYGVNICPPEENSTFNDKYRNIYINERNWFQFFLFYKKLESLKRVLFCPKDFLKNSLEK